MGEHLFPFELLRKWWETDPYKWSEWQARTALDVPRQGLWAATEARGHGRTWLACRLALGAATHLDMNVCIIVESNSKLTMMGRMMNNFHVDREGERNVVIDTFHPSFIDNHHYDFVIFDGVPKPSLCEALHAIWPAPVLFLHHLAVLQHEPNSRKPHRVTLTRMVTQVTEIAVYADTPGGVHDELLDLEGQGRLDALEWVDASEWDWDATISPTGIQQTWDEEQWTEFDSER